MDHRVIRLGHLSIALVVLFGAAACSSTGSNHAGGSSGSSGAGSSGEGASGESESGASSGAASSGSGESSGDAGSTGDASSATPACNSAVKCWTFEDGQIPSDLALDVHTINFPVMVDSVHAYRSTYAMHIVTTEGDSPQTEFQTLLPANFGPTMWGRAFIYTTPMGPANHGGVFKGVFGDGNWYEVGYDLGEYLTIWHPPYPPGYPELVFQTDTPVVSNDWGCVEWEFDGSTAANPLVFLNGTQLTSEAPYVYPEGGTAMGPQTETNFTEFNFGLVMYHDLPNRTDMWFDDIAVAKTRIGCAP